MYLHRAWGLKSDSPGWLQTEKLVELFGVSQAASPSLFLVSWFSYLIEISADFFHKLERLDFQNHFDVSYLRLFTMSIVSNFNFFLLYEIG